MHPPFMRTTPTAIAGLALIFALLCGAGGGTATYFLLKNRLAPWIQTTNQSVHTLSARTKEGNENLAASIAKLREQLDTGQKKLAELQTATESARATTAELAEHHRPLAAQSAETARQVEIQTQVAARLIDDLKKLDRQTRETAAQALPFIIEPPTF
jgi:TolA-binding protein